MGKKYFTSLSMRSINYDEIKRGILKAHLCAFHFIFESHVMGTLEPTND